VQAEGRRAFLNWVGCTLGGIEEGTAECALATLGPFSGPAQASVIGFPVRADIFLAAFINSISSAVHSFNDTHFATVAHPTSPVAAALLALAEYRPLSGKDAILALILGNELQCRVGNMLVEPPAECGVGLSMQGLAGTIGAAVAAGKAIGLNEEAMVSCIGLAANQVCGLREAHASMASAFTPGNAARAGLTAALLAEGGYTCPPHMIEGEKGYAASYARNPVPQAALTGLGSTWEILANAYKPYPCGFVIHPPIDAALELARQDGFNVGEVEQIVLSVNALAIQLCDRPNPLHRRQAVVSVQHWVAAALTFAAAGLQEGSEKAVHHPTVQAMRARIVLVPRDDLGREACELTLHLRDGSTRTAKVAACRGSIGRPMTDAELIEKFTAQAKLLLVPTDIATLQEFCLAIVDAPSFGDIAPWLGAAIARGGKRQAA
jgi:2-methylcitrate dehydratase PrpD